MLLEKKTKTIPITKGKGQKLLEEVSFIIMLVFTSMAGKTMKRPKIKKIRKNKNHKKHQPAQRFN